MTPVSGEIERQRRAQRLRSGLALSVGVWQMLQELADTYNVDLSL